MVIAAFVFHICTQEIQGRLLFTQDTTIASEGSNATFICQVSESRLTLKNEWLFENRTVSENGKLASGVNEDKYKLKLSGTRLEIVNLTVQDGGYYQCIIRRENGELLFSVRGTLNVIKAADFLDEQPTNTSRVFVSSTQMIEPSVASHNLQPSPTASVVPSAAVQTRVFHDAASVTQESQEKPTCQNSSNSTAVAFNMDRTSPNLMKVNEGYQLKLQCTYCSVSPSDGAILSWYKEGVEITNDTRHVIRKNELGIPVAKHLLDQGLYMCVVTFKKQNISRFMTVIVRKAESDPLLSTVLAQNKSFLSVQVTWHLTDHGVFTSAVVSLGLRLINSDEWSNAIGNISLECGRHMFKNLQPGSEYLLNVTLHNKYKQVESRAVVFWSAATNSSDNDHKILVLYQVTNRSALGVALGVVGLLVLGMIMYACVTWCQNDKNGYSIPPGQRNKSETDESDALFSVTSSMYYNKAFEDDKVDWMLDEEIIS